MQQIREIGDVLTNIGDKISEVAMAHDASRVVENCVKYGTAEQRETVHAALKCTIISHSLFRSSYLV
jgi:hypothetical protein